MHRFCAAVLIAVLSASAAAQSVVRGVVHDSLRAAPLNGAFVTITGAGFATSTTSDSAGRFQVDSVPAGTYTISVEHPNIDSIGFPALVARTAVTGAVLDVQIAIPSFATLWRNVCGGNVPPRDTGFVTGVTRDAATRRPIANARVDVSWIETAVDAARKLDQKVYRTDVRSDSSGTFRLCGIPADAAFHVQASTDSTETGWVDVVIADTRFRRRDFFLAHRTPAGRGVVTGTVSETDGRPLRGARVTLDSMHAVQTGEDGRFTIRDALAGTRQLQVTSIGLEPATLVVTVLPRDTTRVTVEMRKVTVLEAMSIQAAARRRRFESELETRKRMGFGEMVDSTALQGMWSLANVFDRFSGTRVAWSGFDFKVLIRDGPGLCEAAVWVDGRRSDYLELSMLFPAEIAVVEVYPHRGSVPARFAGGGQRCGVVAVWTKYALR